MNTPVSTLYSDGLKREDILFVSFERGFIRTRIQVHEIQNQKNTEYRYFQEVGK